MMQPSNSLIIPSLAMLARRQDGSNAALATDPSSIADSFNSDTCVGPKEDFSNCKALTNLYDKCGGEANPILDCYCSQEQVDLIIGCQNDISLCFLGGFGNQPGPNELDVLLDSFHEICDASSATATFTTPSVIAPATTQPACKSALDGCDTFMSSAIACASVAQNEEELTSCICKDQLLSTASLCYVDGARECLTMEPNPTEIASAEALCSVTWNVPVVSGASATKADNGEPKETGSGSNDAQGTDASGSEGSAGKVAGMPTLFLVLAACALIVKVF